MSKSFKKFFAISIFLISAITSNVFALTLTDITNIFAGIDWQTDNGTTTFRSLLIPVGGRAESLGSAYTGLCDDSSYMNFNAAASCIQKETQFAAYHNSWIADSKIETITYTTRFKNFGLGAQASCFYIPFSEYNFFGERVNSSYYTETSVAVNASYNLLAGYDFKGLALGMSVKGAWRGMPNYTDNETDAITSSSGFQQSSLGIMADLGLMLQFNFLKYFASREPNVKIGFALQNAGVAFTGGFGENFQIDDPLPTYVAAGISVQFLPIIGATFDIKQPINLLDIKEYNMFSLSVGAFLDFKIFDLLAGLEIKGGNPKISLGAEFELSKTTLNFNYTIDLTTSTNPVNRISLSAKILLGDRGRANVQAEIDRLYLIGLEYYYNSEWENAIAVWEEVLKLNKRYDPAKLGIQSANSQMDMLQTIKDNMTLDSAE